MLRSCFAQSSRAVASSSSCGASGLHTSAVCHARGMKARNTRATLKANLERRAEKERKAQAIRPHVVLGTRPGEEGKWATCDLGKLILTADKLRAPDEFKSNPAAFENAKLPRLFQFGIREKDKKVLFEHLPALSAEAAFERRAADRARAKRDNSRGAVQATKVEAAEYEQDISREVMKAEQLGRLIAMQNTNAPGMAYENRKRIVEAFSNPSKPGDTGRPEVQAALLTMKIRNLWTHLTTYKRDVVNRRSLRKLIHARAKVLKYLKRRDLDRYNAVLPRLALDPGAIEGELVV
ncbi:S15/NS1 RNA-binding domain-containing protein [Heliocybe sulcata]|uniref:S15/NS1 RNA-binding domain-containing protein n=1 Tax=Heliocybe sulcata TaxID=5364 RepID=A0A5C3NGA4_9AGAM|nr:S15/NS1 RNA-binding domain-containing protein [Heliocybe sulcata]